MMRSPQLLRPPPRLPAPPVRLLPRRAHRRAPRLHAHNRYRARHHAGRHERLPVRSVSPAGSRFARCYCRDPGTDEDQGEDHPPAAAATLDRGSAGCAPGGADVTPAEARRAIDNLGAILTHRLIGAGGETRLQTTARHPVTSGHPQSATIAGMDQDGCGLRPGRALRRYLAPPAAPRRARPLRSRTRPVRETR